MILGIDYGRAKVGLARADAPPAGGLAEPWKVLRVSGWEDAVKKIKTEAEQENFEKIIVGVSEGEMGQEQEKFAQTLSSTVSCEVLTWDEGLSTYDAQQMAHQAGVHGEKLRKLEDAFAASLVLQSWLDSNKL